MIIRAASSSDDDSDTGGNARSTTRSFSFSTVGASPHATASSTLSASTTVKLAWLVATLALVALLLLDLAALVNQFFPANGASEPPSASDPFTVASLALQLWRGRSIATQPATVLNNVLGQLFVGAWIYSRETALVGQRQRSSSRRRSEITNLPACILRVLPWALVTAVLCLGHLASCSYVLVALFESHGGSVRTKFWLGRSSAGSRTAPRV